MTNQEPRWALTPERSASSACDIPISARRAVTARPTADTTIREIQRGVPKPRRTATMAKVARALGWTSDSIDRLLEGGNPEDAEVVRNVLAVGSHEMEVPLDERHAVGDHVYMLVTLDRSDPMVAELFDVQTQLKVAQADVERLQERFNELIGSLVDRGDIMPMPLEITERFITGSFARSTRISAEARERALALAAEKGNVRAPRAKKESSRPQAAPEETS